ncbi:flagellar hook-associated protein FlgK [Sediminibacillus massiliensis]|uniref:flagellar hook-associated protein FlgK n=1 Tax=Sediminibacillus massiliensis TaxID=1926277 RepID=UPI0009884F6C|nr:flagellar hook-associated protein FlgK [Sediminibacillus massiliensis]
MSSTFHGLEVARRALTTQQSALYTTGHNIANANTEGFTRQRVNFEQTSPYPPASRNRPEIPGQVGSGVEAGSIERVRDQFLDMQYRGENAKLGYYESKAEAMKQMESIMNEPSEEGLSKTMDRFWQALQDLSVNPEDSGARSVVRQRGLAVAETFNYLSNSLNSVRSDLQSEMGVTETEANSLINQINNVNKQIAGIEPHGYLPNDLYDERDRLIDKLSGIVNINVSYDKSGGQPNGMATGLATIELADSEGRPTGTKLVDGLEGTVNEVFVSYDDKQNVDNIVFYNPADQTGKISQDNPPTGGTSVGPENFSSNGKLKALMESNGYVQADGEVVGEFSSMLADLDTMAGTFVAEFNAAHQAGIDLEGNAGGTFFTVTDGESAAATMDVHQDIKDNADKIAASAGDSGDKGNGENALDLAEVMRKKDVGLGNNTSIQSFYESAIGDMAVVTQEADRMVNNAGTLRQQVEENRMSVSAVSLDEEMTNMIKFQHAYNAAARNMTAVDEMLDRIINNMGLVGR